ncbi:MULTISPECIES: hypothetical protein [Sphingomonas]|jgi:hypothetical protein|uniref:hypothetical protein n=1 Tax=Sphingomonas TaxID=13687 RepID=UPI001AEA257E
MKRKRWRVAMLAAGQARNDPLLFSPDTNAAKAEIAGSILTGGGRFGRNQQDQR